MIRVPLCGRRGSEVSGWMLLDDIDADLSDAFWSHTRGYAHRRRGPRGSSRLQYAHRIVAERQLGRTLVNGECVDHINGEPSDNRRGNLRVVSNAENGENRHGPTAKNKSGFRGVSFFGRDNRAKPWAAEVVRRGTKYRCGYYATPEEAAAAAAAKRAELGFLTADTDGGAA